MAIGLDYGQSMQKQEHRIKTLDHHGDALK